MTDPTPQPRLLPRTVGRLNRLWHDLSSPLRDRLEPALAPDLPDEAAERVRRQIAACVGGTGGEAAGRARAADLGRAYLELSATGRERFLRILADEFGSDPDAVMKAAGSLIEAPDEAGRDGAKAAMRAALEAPRRRLLTHFNGLPQGLEFLVDMRAEVIRLHRHDVAFAGLDADLRALLASWFDVGFLDLRLITWDAPASLLEKLIAYEAVHQIQSWDDLKNRLESDRRCYAFFHPRMADEPLIFVEVAQPGGGDDGELQLRLARY